MRAIWKFPLLESEWTVQMPKGTEILHVHSQGGGSMALDGGLCVWASVDTEQAEREARTFLTVMTGQPFPDDGRKYIGTAHLDFNHGRLVAHVFEKA